MVYRKMHIDNVNTNFRLYKMLIINITFFILYTGKYNNAKLTIKNKKGEEVERNLFS